MKDKILMLIIGILIGAIITAGGFLLFGKNSGKGDRMNRRDFDTNMIGEDGKRGQHNRDGNSTEEPPTKPESEDNSVAPVDTTENT